MKIFFRIGLKKQNLIKLGNPSNNLKNFNYIEKKINLI